MKHKNKGVFIIAVVAACIAAAYWLWFEFLSVPVLNLTSPMGGRLPIISLQWDGNTLVPVDGCGTVQPETTEVKLRFLNLDASVTAPTEEFLCEQVTEESLEKLLPTGHQLYGLLEYTGSYWLITGRQRGDPYLVPIGSFHRREEPDHTPLRYRTFYKSKSAYLRGGASMSGGQ